MISKEKYFALREIRRRITNRINREIVKQLPRGSVQRYSQGEHWVSCEINAVGDERVQVISMRKSPAHYVKHRGAFLFTEDRRRIYWVDAYRFFA